LHPQIGTVAKRAEADRRGKNVSESRSLARSIESNLIAGVLTIIPVLVVWFVVDFVLRFLFSVGAPFEQALLRFVTNRAPEAAPYVADETFQWCVAIIVALLLIYTVGAAASRVIGKRFIAFAEALIARIPFVETIYSASKKLIGVLQQQPGGAARVVLVEFPHPGMKAVGLVMRTFDDATSGEEMAAVYVPTTPNPTSGYLALVAARKLVATTMTMDQAMTMILSGGAITPDRISTGTQPE
jgi:uncharacterized membrane protein